MAETYMTLDADMLDAVCHKHYGGKSGAVEAVLLANPGLADLGPVLPAGIPVSLPDLPAEEATTVRLWD